MDEILAARYTEILAEIDSSFLDREEAQRRGLSTPFLVNGPKDPAARRIMVIGREFGAKGWVVQPKDKGVSAYVTEALAKHRRFFDRHIAQTSMDRGATFFNFMRDLRNKFGSGGLIYSNLLCIDSGGKDPSKSKDFPLIKDLSKRLLDVQLDHFKPDVVIFANGSKTRSVRVEFFPTRGVKKVCVGRRDWEETGISNMQLWEFELLGRFLCYRIQHPSTQSKASAAARRHLVDVLCQTLPQGQLVAASAAGASVSAIAACEP